MIRPIAKSFLSLDLAEIKTCTKASANNGQSLTLHQFKNNSKKKNPEILFGRNSFIVGCPIRKRMRDLDQLGRLTRIRPSKSSGDTISDTCGGRVGSQAKRGSICGVSPSKGLLPNSTADSHFGYDGGPG